MKKLILTLVAMAAATSLSLAQVGYWTDVGLVPRTGTIDVNTNQLNNNALETGDIAITSNTNVVPAWEDDINLGGPLTDFEATWTVLDRNGNVVTPQDTVTNIPNALCVSTAEALSNCTYRAYFRSDGSPTPSYMGNFGGKLKANRFGDGFAFSSGGGLACELPQLFAINNDDGGAGFGDIPAMQMLNNDGSRNAALGGPDIAGIISFSDADCEPAGNIRPADIEILANGNLLLVGESRQVADRAMTGQPGGDVPVYKVFSSSGAVVMPYTNASSEASGAGMWHGAAVTSNGFALRFNVGTTRIRLFNNSGVPLGPNIDLAAVTCHPEAGAGGRGDGVGFKGNGTDAYVYACSPGGSPWVTVINNDGTIRYSRSVADPGVNATGGGTDRLDTDITPDGRVVVCFQAGNDDTNNPTLLGLPQARIFDPCGRPLGPIFYVSERDNPTNALVSNGGSGRPRVAFRNNVIAAMWGSLNSPATLDRTLSLRIFDVPAVAACVLPGAPPVTITESGGNVIISWPESFGFQTLEATPTISPTAWAPVCAQPAIVNGGGVNSMTVPLGTGPVFFRLRS